MSSKTRIETGVSMPSSFQKTGGIPVAQPKGVKRKPKRWYFTSYTSILVSLAFLGFGLAGVMAITTTAPLWKIGRAVVEWRVAASKPIAAAQNIPVLKLSLRNEGGAGKLPVEIFGRWVVQSAPLQSFVSLGTYRREVALTRTAILEAPLTPLRTAPAMKAALEVVVSTGGRETDRKWIAWN